LKVRWYAQDFVKKNVNDFNDCTQINKEAVCLKELKDSIGKSKKQIDQKYREYTKIAIKGPIESER